MRNDSIVVVLGHGVENDGNPTRVGRYSVKKAVERYGTGSRLLMTGGYTNASSDVSEAEAMRRYAIELGVPERNILMDEQSLDTAANALYSQRLMESLGGPKKVRVHTYDLHMKRARYLFKKAFSGNGYEMKFNDFPLENSSRDDMGRVRVLENFWYNLNRMMFFGVGGRTKEAMSVIVKAYSSLSPRNVINFKNKRK